MFSFLKRNKTYQIRPTALIVMDGFGLAPSSEGNAVSRSRTPNINYYLTHYPSTKLIASGESVGLPANEVGNTEVGHLTLGAGRVIYQDLKRINIALEKGYFYDNRAFLGAASYVKANNSSLHIMGLVGSGQVHSSLEHLKALIQFARKESLQKVFLHLFTDGRDSPTREGVKIIQDIQNIIKDNKAIQIASIHGRYYAMDRDRRWDRTKRSYDAIVMGEGKQAKDPISAVESQYNAGITDEFIEPTVLTDVSGKPLSVIADNDAVIFYNYRIDRPKQLTLALVRQDFEKMKTITLGIDPTTERKGKKVEAGETFKRAYVPKNLYFVTMTQYEKGLPVSAIAFGPEVVENSLNVVISKNNLKQMHMAESEKERFVKYYFDGLRENPMEGEESKIVSSPKVATYDKKPEMSLPSLAKEFTKKVQEDKYHFFIVNIANPDMVAHTGKIGKAIEAVEHTDKYLKIMVDAVLEAGGTVFLTADHGNIEEMLTYPTATFFYTTKQGLENTDHSANPVPLIIIGGQYFSKKVKLSTGSLADVAPTILRHMSLAVPQEMTGKVLFMDSGT